MSTDITIHAVIKITLGEKRRVGEPEDNLGFYTKIRVHSFDDENHEYVTSITAFHKHDDCSVQCLFS